MIVINLDTVALWYIVGITAWGILVMLLSIGEPRRPLTGGIAFWAVLLNVGIILAAF